MKEIFDNESKLEFTLKKVLILDVILVSNWNVSFYQKYIKKIAIQTLINRVDKVSLNCKFLNKSS